MIVFLTGANSFTRREAYDALRALHDRDGSLAANTVVLDGATLSLGELEAAALTVPFLADFRLVRVDGLCERFEAPAARRRDGLGEWERLPDLLRTVPAATLLIFQDDAVPPSNPIRVSIAEAGEVRDFPALRHRDLVPWVRDRARALGLQLAPAAAQRLVAQVGNDLWALSGELEKLQIYAGDAGVDEAVVVALSPVNREANIFQLVDAVAEGRPARAMQALDAVRSAGETSQRIVSMLARQMRMIAVAREVLDRGGSAEEVQEQLKVRQFVAGRAVDQARCYTQAAADAALRRVLQCEVAIQNYRHDRPGGLREEVAVELLVADLSRARR